MNQALVDVSSACAWGAIALGGVQALRAGLRRHTLWMHAGALALTAIWALSVSAYVRDPMSSTRAAAVLAALALALGAWPMSALALSEARRPRLWSRWAMLLGALAVWSTACAATLWTIGLDWVAGIGSEPLIILSRAGLVAAALAGVPALVALVTVARQLGPQWARMPRLLLGTLGAIGSQLVLWACLVGYGYVTAAMMTPVVALCAVASLIWILGVAREVPAVPRVALSRRLVYGVVATSLVVAYALAAGLAVGWIRLAAQATTREILPALAFLVLAGLGILWARWRQTLWVAINRHVFGSKFDYGEVWIALADITSRAGGLEDLVQRSADFCRQTIGAPEVSIWVADASGNLRCAARASELDTAAAATSVALPPQGLPSHGENDLAAATRASFACPIKVGARLLGVLAAGSVRQPASLDAEDREILRHVAAQLAGALGIYRLGEDLADARELASFHRLSGFVIHDLKNLAVQQSFVLENAKRHGRDPRFVDDALAAFADSTQRMRTLIGKLRSREVTPAAPPAPCDVGDVVRQILSTPGLVDAPGCHVRSALPERHEPCFAVIDRGSLVQVLSHLLMNAIESLTGDEGEVAISVQRRDDGCVRIDVSDDGRGMSEEFLREHAFRPFRTTKKSGLGVGLHQCKTLVEAVGGTIGIVSAEGRGTTVSINLPGRVEAAELNQVA